MPQMSPMNWLFLFLVFSSTFFIVLTKVSLMNE